MKTSLFAFATDLDDEGTDVVLANVGERAGVDAISLAVAYHAARDVFPHSPARKVRFLEPGAVFFAPEPRRYGRLKPRPSRLVQSADPLRELCERAGARGIAVNAWTVYLHSDRLGFEHPDCAPLNAFGDPYLTDLCPANPEVREYARALTADVSRYPVAAIRAESLQFSGLEHGYHHERYFDELGALATMLLSLCFCRHCVTAAGGRGVDGERLAALVRAAVGPVLGGDGEPSSAEPTRELVGALGDGEMDRYLDARAATVTSLAGELAELARASGVVLTFMDMAGAEKGFAGGASGPPAAADAWRGGVDPAAVAASTGGLEAVGYAADPARLREDLEAYLALVAEPAQLAVALRPMAPDCRTPQNLAAKVALARDFGLGAIDFYHYGLSRLRSLDWISAALGHD